MVVAVVVFKGSWEFYCLVLANLCLASLVHRHGVPDCK